MRVSAGTAEMLEAFRADARFFPSLSYGERPSLDRAISVALLRAQETIDPALRAARLARDRSVREFAERQEETYRSAGGV